MAHAQQLEKQVERPGLQLTRREFNKALFLLMGTVEIIGVANLIRQLSIDRTTPYQNEHLYLPEIDLNPIVDDVVASYQRELEVQIDLDAVKKDLTWVNSAAEFKQTRRTVIRKDETDQELSQILGFTAHSKIYLNGERIRLLLTPAAGQAVAPEIWPEVLTFILSHELVHYAVAQYPAEFSPRTQQFFTVLFELFGDAWNDAEGEGIYGANVLWKLDREIYTAFEELEEAEAVVLGQYVFRQSDSDFKLVQEPNARVELLELVLIHMSTRMGIKVEELYQRLAEFRIKEGGREEWAALIGKSYGVQEGEIRIGVRIMWLIETADRENYDVFYQMHLH